MTNPDTTYDVVIAGAGPVGLLLACELHLADVSVLVLEKATDLNSALKQLPFGMRGLSSPTIEAFYRRGMLEDIVAQQDHKKLSSHAGAANAAHWMQQARRPGGHFAGIQFFHDRIDTGRWSHRLPTPAPTSLATTMEQIETVLAARALAMGVEIRRGFGVRDVEQTSEGVTVRTDNETFYGRWLVGCDGGRSAVRKVGGFQFVGTDPEFTGCSVQVEMTDPNQIPAGRLDSHNKPAIPRFVTADPRHAVTPHC